MKSTRERFWDKVSLPHGVTDEDCWEWCGGMYASGYGLFTINSNNVRAHRASWMLCKSEIPNKLFVCHHCDNPRCVNPSHLFLGTNSDNVRDMFKKGRSVNQNKFKTHCIHGHELTSENLYYYPGRNGNLNRACKACNLSRSAKRHTVITAQTEGKQ